MKIDSRRRILVLSRKSIRNRLSRMTESGTGEPREGARDRQSNEIGNSFAFFSFLGDVWNCAHGSSSSRAACQSVAV